MNLISRAAQNRRYSDPLLFVHGISGGSWIWEWHYLPYFADLGYDTHALNLTGHHTDAPPPNYHQLGTRNYLRDLEQVIDQLGNPIVIGHSAGGFLLQKYLERHRLKGAVLFASVGPNGMEKGLLALRVMQRLFRVLSNLATGKPWYLYQTPEGVRVTMFCRFSMISEEEVRKIASLISDESYRWVMELAFGRGRSLPPRDPTTPILVVAPQEDFFVTPRAYESLAIRYGAELYRAHRTGHAVQLESGWRAAADAIHRWIQTRVLGAQGAPTAPGASNEPVSPAAGTARGGHS